MKKEIAEFIGTFTLVLFGCGAAVIGGMGTGATAIDVLGISFAFGLAIVDTVGHYGRPDVFKLLIRQDEWREAGSRGKRVSPALADQLKRAAEARDVDERKVLGAVERMAEAAE